MRCLSLQVTPLRLLSLTVMTLWISPSLLSLSPSDYLRRVLLSLSILSTRWIGLRLLPHWILPIWNASIRPSLIRNSFCFRWWILFLLNRCIFLLFLFLVKVFLVICYCLVYQLTYSLKIRLIKLFTFFCFSLFDFLSDKITIVELLFCFLLFFPSFLKTWCMFIKVGHVFL